MRWMLVGALVLSVTACGSWKGDGNDEVVPDPIGPALGLKKSFGVPVALAGEEAGENLKNNRQAEEAGEGEEHAAPAHGAAAHGSEVAPKAVGGHGEEGHGSEGHGAEHKAEH